MADMFTEITEDMKDRMSHQHDSRAATADEVRICWLICEVDDLRAEKEELLAHINRLEMKGGN
jgi:hypothetical protein